MFAPGWLVEKNIPEEEQKSFWEKIKSAITN